MDPGTVNPDAISVIKDQILPVLNLLGQLALLVGVIFTLAQLRKTDRQFKHQKESSEAQTFKLISDKWSEIYEARNNLLKKNFVPQNCRYFEDKYKMDYEAFLSSDDWKQYRSLCAFFEMIGVLLYRNDISEEDLFVLVSVDVFKRVSETEQQTIPEGVIYSKLKGPIEYLRKNYREDIYYFYDKYLLEKYKNRALTKLPLYDPAQPNGRAIQRV